MIADSRPAPANRVAAAAELLDRMPAQADDAERGLLASVLLDPRVWPEVAAIIGEHDLRLPHHRRLWRELAAMVAEGQPVDATLLVARLGAGGLRESGGLAYLAEIADAVAAAHNAVYYARLVLDRSVQRKICELGIEMVRLGRDDSGPARDAESLLADVATIIRRLPSIEHDDDSPADDDGYRPFPLAALPPIVRDLVTAGAAAIDCEPAMIALPALSMLAAAIGDSRRIAIGSNWVEPPALWTAIVAESGTRKTPAINCALGAVRRRQARAFAEFGVTPQRCMTGDTTVEALVRILAKESRGVLLSRDELAGWFLSQNQYRPGGKGNDSQAYLEMYDGGQILVDRRTAESGVIYVPRAVVSITGGIQPAVLRTCLAGQNMVNGLAHRFLMTRPPRRVQYFRDASVSAEAEAAISDLLDGCYEKLQCVASDDGPQPRIVRLRGEPKREFVAWVNRRAEFDHGLFDEHLRAAASKVRGRALRLVLILHCIRQVEAGVIDDADVDVLTVRDAIAIAEWGWHETERIYAMLGESPVETGRRELAEIVAAMPSQRITPRQLRDKGAKWKAKGAAELALDALAAEGTVRKEFRAPGPKGGRPTCDYVLNVRETKTSPNAGNGEVSVPRTLELESGEV